MSTRVDLRPRVRPRRRGLDVGLVLLLVLAASVSAVALDKAQSSAGLAASAVVAEPSEPARAVTSLWFGDSIVEGCCRSSATAPTMASVAARRLGWAPPQIAAAGGTGYTTERVLEGVRSGTYVERIAAAVEGSYYDVVVVAGGNNDDTAAFNPVQFRTAVRRVLEQVRTSLPEAVLVVLGPYSADGTGYLEQRTIVQEEASRVSAVYVDQVEQGWMQGRDDDLHSDGYHPDDSGHAYLGGRVAAALDQALPAELTPGTAPVGEAS